MHLELRLVSSPPPGSASRRAGTTPGAASSENGEEIATPSLIVSADEELSIKTVWETFQKKRKREGSASASTPLSVDADGFKIPPRPSSQSATKSSGKRPVKRRRTSSTDEDDDLLPTPPTSSLPGATKAEDEDEDEDDEDEPPRSVYANPKWSAFEDEVLLRGVKLGWTSKTIQRELGPNTIRTDNAIRGRKLSLKRAKSSSARDIISSAPSTVGRPRQKPFVVQEGSRKSKRSKVSPSPDHKGQTQDTPSPLDYVPQTQDTPTPDHVSESQDSPPVVPSLEEPERSTTPSLASSPPIAEATFRRAKSPIVLIPRISTGKLRMPSRVSSAMPKPARARSSPEPSPTRERKKKSTPKRRPQRPVSPTLSEQPMSAQQERIPSPEVPTSAQQERIASPAAEPMTSQGAQDADASTPKPEPARRTWSCSRNDLLRGLPADFIDNLVRVRAKTENISKKRAREDTAADNAFWNATLNEDESLVDEIERLRRIKKHQRAVEDGKTPPGRRNRLEGLPMLQTSDDTSVDESFGPEDDFAVPTFDSDEENQRGDEYVSDDDGDEPGEDEPEEDDDGDVDMIKDRPFVEVEEEPLREPSPAPQASKSERRKAKKSRTTETRRAGGTSDRGSIASSSKPDPSREASITAPTQATADREASIPAPTKIDTPAPATSNSSSSLYEGRWAEILAKAQFVPPAPKRQEPPKVYSTDDLHLLYFGESSDEDVKLEGDESD